MPFLFSAFELIIRYEYYNSMKKTPVGVYKNKGSNTYYFSSSLNIDPNITYRNRIFGFNSIEDAYKAKKEYERKVRAIKDKNKINGLIKRVTDSRKRELLRHFLNEYLDYEITDLFNESSINKLRNKINKLDISISYKNKAISAIKELVLLAYDKSYIDEISKEIRLISKKIKELNDSKNQKILNAMESEEKSLSTKIKKPKTFEKITRFFSSRINAYKVILKTVIEPFENKINQFNDSEIYFRENKYKILYNRRYKMIEKQSFSIEHINQIRDSKKVDVNLLERSIYALQRAVLI